MHYSHEDHVRAVEEERLAKENAVRTSDALKLIEDGLLGHFGNIAERYDFTFRYDRDPEPDSYRRYESREGRSLPEPRTGSGSLCLVVYFGENRVTLSDSSGNLASNLSRYFREHDVAYSLDGDHVIALDLPTACNKLSGALRATRPTWRELPSPPTPRWR